MHNQLNSTHGDVSLHLTLPQSTIVMARRKLMQASFPLSIIKAFSHLLYHFPKKWSWIFFFLNENLFLAYSVYLPTEQLGHYLWRTSHSFPKEVIPVTSFQVFWVRHKRKEKSFPEKSKSNRQNQLLIHFQGRSLPTYKWGSWGMDNFSGLFQSWHFIALL